MRNLMWKASRWARGTSEEIGQTVIEYALVVAAVSVVLIVGLWTFGDAVVDEAQTRVGNVWSSLGGDSEEG